MDNPGALGPQVSQHPRHGLDPLARERSRELALDAGGVRKRTQQVEDGPGPEFRSGSGHVPHGAVMAGRHHEPHARFTDRALDDRDVGVDVDPERDEDVGGAGL